MAPSSRARTSSSPSKAKTTGKAKPRNSTTKSKKPAVRKGENASDDEHTLSEDQEAYEASEADEDEYLDSDALDEDNGRPGTAKKRKRASAKKGRTSPKKRRSKDDNDEDSDEDLLDGQTIAGRIVKAPTEGQGTILVGMMQLC